MYLTINLKTYHKMKIILKYKINNHPKMKLSTKINNLKNHINNKPKRTKNTLN